MSFPCASGSGQQLLYCAPTESLQRQSTLRQLDMVLDFEVNVQRLSCFGAITSDSLVRCVGECEAERGRLCGLWNHMLGMESSLGVCLELEVHAHRQPARTAVDVFDCAACGCC